ncbi:MAG: hypothetical protein EZS28_042365 [Streblomastix strix]|uniref:Uncharacterized protein n=1 Tax=Streblomastix strix TaxID=222440 RepID=A0A5J4TVC7_9EUKA|nr:MAG: hypothetical protein EZS28_042365 [Streblomastix strix]
MYQRSGQIEQISMWDRFWDGTNPWTPVKKAKGRDGTEKYKTSKVDGQLDSWTDELESWINQMNCLCAR